MYIRGLLRSLVLAAAVILTVAVGPAGAVPAVQVFQVTSDADLDAETSLAINPTDSDNVVAGWISDEEGCAYGASFDGGRTWTSAVLPGVQTDSGGRFDVGTDPTVAFDGAGNAYFTCLGFDLFPPGTTSPGAILVARSTDGGLTWSEPVVAFEGATQAEWNDHQFLSTNPVTGDVYVTETLFKAGHGKPKMLFLKSTDEGATWSTPVVVSRPSQGSFFQDSFAQAGADPDTVYVFYRAFINGGAASRIFLVRSTNGGTTFEPAQPIASFGASGTPVHNHVWMAVDRATNRIYVTFADARNGDADIWLLRVVDDDGQFVPEGLTRVNDDPIGNGAVQFFPKVTVAPNSRVDVCFQDTRYDPGHELVFTTCASSTDGGLTFGNQQVTPSGFDPSNNSFLGDYNGQDSLNDLVMPSWAGDGVFGGDDAAQEVFVARVAK